MQVREDEPEKLKQFVPLKKEEKKKKRGRKKEVVECGGEVKLIAK